MTFARQLEEAVTEKWELSDIVAGTKLHVTRVAIYDSATPPSERETVKIVEKLGRTHENGINVFLKGVKGRVFQVSDAGVMLSSTKPPVKYQIRSIENP